MSPNSDKSKLWREKNKEAIAEWKKRYDELSTIRFQERWDTDKYETEIGMALPDKDLREIWTFCTYYMSRYKSSKLSRFYFDVIYEIMTYGTLEPSRKKIVMKSVNTTRRKMNAR